MTGRSLASEPLTGRPRATRMRATADIPTPPMPMKCTRPRDSAVRAVREVCWCSGWVIPLPLPAVLYGFCLRGRHRFEDETGHAPVCVPDAELFRAGRHPGEPVRV